jgi:hypothetical protein
MKLREAKLWIWIESQQFKKFIYVDILSINLKS